MSFDSLTGKSVINIILIMTLQFLNLFTIILKQCYMCPKNIKPLFHRLESFEEHNSMKVAFVCAFWSHFLHSCSFNVISMSSSTLVYKVVSVVHRQVFKTLFLETVVCFPRVTTVLLLLFLYYTCASRILLHQFAQLCALVLFSACA